jgi:hypothetical protein
MSSALRTRVAKLHANSIGDVNSQIIVKRADIILRNVLHGTNPNKIIRIVVRL